MVRETQKRNVSEKGQKEGYVLKSEGGRSISAAGVGITIKAMAGDTDGKFMFGVQGAGWFSRSASSLAQEHD